MRRGVQLPWPSAPQTLKATSKGCAHARLQLQLAASVSQPGCSHAAQGDALQGSHNPLASS